MKNKIYYTVTDQYGNNYDCSVIYREEQTTDDILLDLSYRRFHVRLTGYHLESNKVRDIRVKRKVYCD